MCAADVAEPFALTLPSVMTAISAGPVCDLLKALFRFDI